MSETPPVELDAPARDTRRIVAVAVLGVALLVAAVLLATTVLGGGGGDSASDEAVDAPPTSTAPAEPAPDEVGDGAAADEGYEVYTTRNPFTPLVATGGESATTESTAAPEEATETPAAPEDDAASQTETTEPGTTDPGSGGASGQRVQLLDVTTDTTGKVVASVEVDGTVYDVAEGESFASAYSVVSLSVENSSGVFREGDREFTLTTGEELLK